MKTITSSYKTKIFASGFGITNGKNRAKNAIKMALSMILKNKLLENDSLIVLQIAYGTKEITMEELKIITDAIQEKLGNTYTISIQLSENRKLENNLSVTLEICGS